VFVDMPLESIHKLAFKAAQAARCAGEQGKYWEMHDRLFENQKALAPWTPHAEAVGLDVAAFEQCLESGEFDKEIRRQMGEARRVGVTGTPAFMIGQTEPNSSKVKVLAVLKGAKPFADFKTEIDRLLERPPAAAGDPAEEDVAAGEDVDPDSADAAALRSSEGAPARAVSPVEAKTLGAEAVEALQRVLATAPEGSPAWITAPRSDLGAITRAEDLARVFSSAGWRVEPISRTALNVRAGIYLFAGDEHPPVYVGTAHRALEEAGLTPTYASGYRDYFVERTRTDATFRGFPFAPDQTFLLVVGRTP
jgi:hypothetical protein